MEQLLTTKLYIPPTRPEHISRPALIDRLNNSLHRKLTLISAPAGFGKTMLISEWVHSFQSIAPKKSQTENRIAWISLDKNENDPARFLAYFVVALMRTQVVNSTVGEGVLGILQSPQSLPITDILTSLINKIATITGKLIIVIDDFHVIESRLVCEAVTFLIEHLPPQIHLVIATRDDPPLPLARLRAQGQMTELRAIDLRFTSPEIARFLNQLEGINLSAKEIAILETRSEGWIVGLQLAALAIQGHISMQGHKDSASSVKSFAGSNRFVLDYLLEEVLNQQSESVNNFLLQTSILNRFTGSLCDALTGQDNGQETLENLERANLFIVPLDAERRWYRYHHLFADLLRLRLQQTQMEKTSTLHKKASEWHEQNGLPDEAIEHALRAKDFERATQLLDTYMDKILNRGEYTNVWRWLGEIPEKFILSKPDLCILNAWHLFTSGHLDAAEQNLQAAEKHLLPGINPAIDASSNDSEMLVASKIRGRVAAIRAFVASYRGDVPGIIQNAHHALDILPKQDLVWRSTVAIALGDAYGITGDMNAAYKARVGALETSKTAGNIYLIFISAMKLAITVRMQGQLHRVIEICQQYHHLATEKGVSQMMVVGWLFSIWAEVLAEINELDEALTKGRKGVELTAHSEDIAMSGWSHVCLAKVLFTRGDIPGAEETIRKMEEITLDHHMPPYVASMISAWRARILLAQNKLDAIYQWCEIRNLKVEGKLTQLNEGEYIVFARILFARGKWDEAVVLLQRLFETAEAGGWVSKMIEILNLQALAFQASGDTDQALTILEKALELAEPGGFVRVFVNEGPSMARLLYEAANLKIAPDYA
ncbi:MAG: tetratricopeptide repeat protein, partial [Chloroflexi bacterium]|nr:tetratricopeptide repeat protein [Chloroflexota bacterium]